MGIIHNVANAYLNWNSFKTKRKILVIESDDWGSRRTDNQKILHRLNTIHNKVANDRFIQLDNIESAEDLSIIFDVLQSVKDCTGKPACLTANVCVANPNFDKIRESDYYEFFYEPFYETIRRGKDGDEVLNLIAKGIQEGLFQPQLHGREHVHALAWLAELRTGNDQLLKAFDLGVWGIPYQAKFTKKRKNLQAALDIYGYKGEEEFQHSWILDGSRIFEQYFGYRSTTFIPPAYTWHTRILKSMPFAGIDALQGIKLQYQPKTRNLSYKKIPHFTGQRAKYGVKYMIRNVFFEPASSPEKDWVDKTLSGIEKSFNLQQPAIIGSHRINYIGSLNEQNRTDNLQMLQTILKKVIQKWPDVEFMSSDQLACELN